MSKKQAESAQFEDNIRELTEIVRQLEQGELSLEQALAFFERGVVLTRLSQQQLQAAEQKVQLLVQQAQGEQLVPFQTDSGV
ncbi:exodeoxyribonuclease VII small subunit [Rheinheimera texasensis]|uniref:exodeoxyribonuclease VII small subunit n=1 Tax=Rheinheimera texasensis TaxID=306205 RepID=UPI0004E1A949|nr:exodeoxyribonuclease VII small subunit [Rheinheimera texasensis]